MPGRDGHGEGRPASGVARDRDRAAVKFDEILHEREADAGALVCAGACVFDTVEPLEHARQLVSRYADTGVFDPQRDRPVGLPQRYGDPSLERELERVRQQIQDDLLPHLPIDVHGPVERRAVDVEREAAAFDRRSERAGQINREAGRDRSARTSRACGPASMREKSSSEFTSLRSRSWFR